VPKVLADMHIPPAMRRWGTRLGLAVIVAIAIGYVPGEVLRHDPRTDKLHSQIEQLQAEAKILEGENAALVNDVEALETDVHAIEDHARADLGMVYPDEVVIRVGEP
jgi:cell division protein FtsB